MILLLLNPFLIQFPERVEPTTEDYISIQHQLHTLAKEKVLDPYLLPEDSKHMRNYLNSRCSVGIRQTLIHPEASLYPIREFIKIGRGGNRCIVSFASYEKNYPTLLKAIPAALEKCGFNGYFLYRIGGFPNPTGTELAYAGVPYAFKIFMMKEAQNLGFEKILWIDSSALPLRDPAPLFQIIEKTGAIFHGWHLKRETPPDDIFSIGRQTLTQITGVDIMYAPYIVAGVFGLDLGSPQVQKLIETYYTLVHSGLPFLSEWPETYVLMALFTQPQNKNWKLDLCYDLINGPAHDESDKKIEEARQKGYYFYIRKHN